MLNKKVNRKNKKDAFINFRSNNHREKKGQKNHQVMN